MLGRLFLLVQKEQTVQRQAQKPLRQMKQQDQEQKFRLWTGVV